MARYSGDTTYGPAVSNSLNLQAEDFTISCNSTNIDMVQGTTQAVNCPVWLRWARLSGPIEVSCAEQNTPQVGAIGCTFSPNVIQSSGQTTLTIVTVGGDVAQDRRDERPSSSPWPVAGGGLLLTCVLLSPVRRRKRLRRSGRLLVFLLAAFTPCRAGSCSNSVDRTNASGTPLGAHTLQALPAAAAVNTVSVSHNAYLTVNVTP